MPIVVVEPVSEYTSTGRITIVTELPRNEIKWPSQREGKARDRAKGAANRCSVPLRFCSAASAGIMIGPPCCFHCREAEEGVRLPFQRHIPGPALLWLPSL
ncbi:hypothetical protein D3C81_683820 [compost metagenome]